MPLQITEEEWGQTHLVKARQMKRGGTSPSRPLSSNSFSIGARVLLLEMPIRHLHSSRNWKPGQSSLLFSCLMLFYWWVSSCCFKMSLKSIPWVIIPRLFFLPEQETMDEYRDKHFQESNFLSAFYICCQETSLVKVPTKLSQCLQVLKDFISLGFCLLW